MASGGGERVIAANPIPIAGGRVVASPFQYYVDGNDNLRLEGWNTASGAILLLQGRFLTEEGKIDVFSRPLPLTNDRVKASIDIPLARGFVLNAVLTVIGATPKLGQTFARLSVIRGFSGATLVMGVLLQGLVTSQQALAWPGSPIATSYDCPGVDRVVLCTDPAAATPISETVPTGARWSLLAAYGELATDATAGNRSTYVEHMPIGLPVYISIHPQLTPASTGAAFFWACGFPISAVTVNNLSTANLSTPSMLASGEQVRINVSNMQAGDQLSDGRLQLLEWLEVT